MNNGRAFEELCAEKLMRDGWTVSHTPTSGDQGADLIAVRGQTSIAIQCKDHALPVGNKAVQEAFSSKAYYGTKFAAVVSSNGFTNAAFELATKTEVLLSPVNNIVGLKFVTSAHIHEESNLKEGAVDRTLENDMSLVISASDAQAEIFRALRLVEDQVELSASAQLFLSKLDDESCNGSGEIDAQSFIYMLKIADTALTSQVELTPNNLSFIRASEDAKVQALELRENEIEYWELLGDKAIEVQNALQDYLKLAFIQIFLAGVSALGGTDLSEDFHFPNRNV